MSRRQMGLQHIESFRSVIMTGSMTKAAEQLHTSQPQISRLISQLEEITRFPLFVRNGTHIATTTEGLRFFEEVEKSFVGLANLETAVANIRSFKGEKLRVAAMPRLAGGLLTRAVAAFKRDYPSVMISIHSGTASAVHSWISSGICDVGLAMIYGDSAQREDFEPIIMSNCVCILPAGHRLASKDNICAADLTNEPFITFSSGSSLRTLIDGFFRDANIEPDVVAETDLGASACTLVGAGLGVSLINPIAAREEATAENITVRPINPNLTVTLGLVLSPYRQHARQVTLFKTYAKHAIIQEFSCELPPEKWSFVK